MPTRGQIIVKMGLYLLFKAIYFLEIKIKSILDVQRWIVEYIFINKSVVPAGYFKQDTFIDKNIFYYSSVNI